MGVSSTPGRDFLARFKLFANDRRPLRRIPLRHPGNRLSFRSRQVAACTFEVPKDSLPRLLGVNAGDGGEEHCGGSGEMEVMFRKDGSRFRTVRLGGHNRAFATGDGGGLFGLGRSRGEGGGESSPVWSPFRPDLAIIPTIVTVVNVETDSSLDTRSCGLEFQPVLNVLESPARSSQPDLSDREAGHRARVDPRCDQFGNGHRLYFLNHSRNLHTDFSSQCPRRHRRVGIEAQPKGERERRWRQTVQWEVCGLRLPAGGHGLIGWAGRAGDAQTCPRCH